ncbi:MAG: hypothetical protein JNK49_12800 [Planctomycetes bacterium]|nr:hypothetical protein [Planctomycetota bacterium]
MSQIKFALAFLPRLKFMACRYVKPSRPAKAASGAIGMRSRAMGIDMSSDAKCAVATGYITASLGGTEHADLVVTLRDGSECQFSVPILSAQAIEGGGGAIIDLPDAADSEVASIELEVVAESGGSIEGLPFSARRKAQRRVDESDEKQHGFGVPGDILHGVSGRGTLAVLPGVYDVALDRRVGVQAVSTVCECAPGRVTKLRMAVPQVVGCSVIVGGEDGLYLGSLAYGVVNVKGERVAGYVGPPGKGPQVWLSEGSYVCNVSLGFLGTRVTPLVVSYDGKKCVEAVLDVGK